MPGISARAALRVENARLIDGTGAAPVDDAVVVADEHGAISYAGPALQAPPSPGTPVVDAAGGTVLPGFFDCHIHLGMPSDRPLVTERVLRDPVLSVLETGQRMQATLDAGVTTARDLGGLAAAYRTAVEKGMLVGPRLRVAVGILSHTGGHGDLVLPSGVDMAAGMSEIADSVDEVRVATRRMLRAGADVIKLCATGGMASPYDDPDDEGLTETEIRTVVEEARLHRGHPVAAHAQGLTGILAAILGGVTSVDHGYGIDEQGCDLLGEKEAFLVPTLSTVYAGIDKARMADWHYQKKTRWSGITKENIAHAIEKKVTIALGTDAPIAPHGQNLRELSYLVDLGMDPMDAILAGTRNSARLLGLDQQLGTLEAGKTADLIICAGDPLADIGVLGQADNVVLVAQQGVIRKNLLPANPLRPQATGN